MPASVPRTEEVVINMEDFAPSDCDKTIPLLLKRVNRTLREYPLPGWYPRNQGEGGGGGGGGVSTDH